VPLTQTSVHLIEGQNGRDIPYKGVPLLKLLCVKKNLAKVCTKRKARRT
jgi:hypothetical protein